MSRATRALAVTTVAAIAASVWLYRDNRALRSELDALVAPTGAPKVATARTPDPWLEPSRVQPASSHTATPAPALPDQKEESRLERRARHQQEFAAMFGRLHGETDDIAFASCR